MSITSTNTYRDGDTTIVTVTSDLSGDVWFHWYLDGQLISSGLTPQLAIKRESGTSGRLEVQDTTDPEYDTEANAPDGYRASRYLWWVRSDESVAHYRVEQNRAAAGWVLLGIVFDSGDWIFDYNARNLDDLTDYEWRVVPVDSAGNEGDALSFGLEHVVRTPDAPDFDVGFDAGTTKVTFSEAS